MKRLLILITAIATAGTVEAQQPRAPAGGTFVNGRFYAGGQFIPQHGGFGMFPGVFPGMVGIPGMESSPQFDMPTRRRKIRLEGRDGASREATARSRLRMARNLLKSGNRKAAREWAAKVVGADMGPATTGEARALLDTIDGREGRAARRTVLGPPAANPAGGDLVPAPPTPPFPVHLLVL